MINFRYHIVSLMAVFLALAVGIAVGVSLGTPVDEGLVQQAEQDRQQVSALRAELDRRNAIDAYRQTYEERTGAVVADGVLNGERVALVTMPDAPGAVTQALSSAVEQAGGTVVATVKVGEDAFDPTRAERASAALDGLADQLGLNDSMTQATRVGTALAEAVADKQSGNRSDLSRRTGEALSAAGLADVSPDVGETAQLVVVVTAPAATPPVADDVLATHVQLDLALKDGAAGVVLAGPNSEGIEGTDVLKARTTASATDRLSTVDVADLASGVTTTVLAGKEQLLGRQAHYGALARADAPLPTLPVR